MTKPTQRLGKGLSALIPSRPISATSPSSDYQAAAADRQLAQNIPVDRLTTNPLQPRTVFADVSLAQLADSIRQRGVLQPIIVRPKIDGQYELVAGERRWRAAKLAGLTAIPAIVRDVTDAQALELALIENLQREDLAPLERAAAYQHYLDTFGCTIDELAQRLSESRPNISNYLRLLKLRPEVCYLLGTGELGMGQARALAAVTNPQRQLAIAKLAVRRNLAVRQVEQLVREASEPLPASPPATSAAAASPQRQHLADVADAFSRALGLPVRIVSGKRKNSGRVIIFYGTLDEFDRLAERIGATAHLE